MPEPPETTLLSFDEFKRMDLVTAKILEVEDHPKADKLWVLTVDVGALGKKKIVAGIKNAYPKANLTGKTIILVNNLQPTSIRGVASEAMLLATQEGEKIVLLTTDAPVQPGAPVK